MCDNTLLATIEHYTLLLYGKRWQLHLRFTSIYSLRSMRRDPSYQLSCCSTTVLDLFVPFRSGQKEAMPLGCEDSWFDELKFKAPSVVLVDKRANDFTWPKQGFLFSRMKLHSKFLRRWCGGLRMLRWLHCRQNESVYNILGLLRRADTAVDDIMNLPSP